MPDDPHLLIVAATTGYQTRMFAEAAARLGTRYTLATDRCRHLDDPWGDDAVAIRFEDPAGAAEALQEAAADRGRFTAVVALADRATLVGSLAAQQFGIPFHPAHAVEAAANKFLTKERFRAAGLLQPQYRRLLMTSDAAEAADNTTYPCVVKPLGLSGSRGVIRVDDRAGFFEAFHVLRKMLSEPDLARMADERHAFIQVETFIPGVEFAIEGIVTDGRLKVLALFDKPDPLNGPYFEETLYVTPSRHPQLVQDDILQTVERGVAALGLRHGPIHAEVRHNQEGTWILEIGARPIGGYCARALRFRYSGGIVGLEELILRHALGEDVALARTADEATGILMIPIPKAGLYTGVKGVEEAEKVPGVGAVLISAVSGQRLKRYPEASSYLGFIFATGETPDRVEESLRAAHGRLQFEIATVLV